LRFETVLLDIEMIWTATPDWDTSLAQRVKVVSPSPPTAIGTVRLPVPPGDVKTVTVETSGVWSTQGGNIGGYDVPPQKGKILAAASRWGYTGSDGVMAWKLAVQYAADGTSGIFAVIALLQGKSP
jgi:hypothetical protein